MKDFHDQSLQFLWPLFLPVRTLKNYQFQSNGEDGRFFTLCIDSVALQLCVTDICWETVSESFPVFKSRLKTLSKLFDRWATLRSKVWQRSRLKCFSDPPHRRKKHIMGWAIENKQKLWNKIAISQQLFVEMTHKQMKYSYFTTHHFNCFNFGGQDYKA